MKIRCERCRARIDTNKHDFCPKCGANFYTDIAFEEPKPDESCINTISAETNKPSEEARQPQQTNKKKTAVQLSAVDFLLCWLGGLYLPSL